MEGKATPVQDHVTETPVPAPLDAAPAQETPGELRGAMLPRARDLRAARPSGTTAHLALPALATAVLLNLCYFPVAWGWLGWVALVPLLCLVRAEASRRRLFLTAWLGGAAFFFPILRWMPVADYRMYYTCFIVPETGFVSEEVRAGICAATSPNGFDWTKISTDTPTKGLVLAGREGLQKLGAVEARRDGLGSVHRA